MWRLGCFRLGCRGVARRFFFEGAHAAARRFRNALRLARVTRGQNAYKSVPPREQVKRRA